ncbi:SRPBCC family protein [Niabella sp. W65]|nr:SRPBCC family protein [Niabella sp. W65]MCH7365183.1 SRPBCC family protein [Niabella sp. W65]ULT40996.1 SRPBCC family protein [Niabella sp. I65]
MDNTAEREIRITQIFDASAALIWEVWTNPDHIAHWWGPAGFTTTIHEMDLREEGSWRLTLHGPDGTNYPNRSVYKELIPLQKIVFEHFNPHFFTTVLFKPTGTGTQLEWSMVFDSAEQRAIIVKAHKADEGLRQNIERLEAYLSLMRGEKTL